MRVLWMISALAALRLADSQPLGDPSLKDAFDRVKAALPHASVMTATGMLHFRHAMNQAWDVHLSEQGIKGRWASSTMQDLELHVQRVFAASAQSTKKAYVWGEPKVCCIWDAAGQRFETEDVYGPFVTTCLDSSGALKAVEFVGVCDFFGNACQTSSAFWLSEVWRFEIDTGLFKKKHYNSFRWLARYTHDFCFDWAGVAASTSAPPDDWLRHFKHGRSFLVWEDRPHAAIETPLAELIAKMLSKEGGAQLGQMISQHRHLLANEHFKNDTLSMVRMSIIALQQDVSQDPANTRQQLAERVLLASMLLSSAKSVNTEL